MHLGSVTVTENLKRGKGMGRGKGRRGMKERKEKGELGARFSLQIYTIGRYETPSLHTAIEVGSQVSNCCWQNLS